MEEQLKHFSNIPIIETIGVTKVYKIGKQLISPVTDISLQIGYGDFVVIFGPSGAGKTTLLNVLMGIEKPDVGEVRIKGESFYEFSDQERAKIRLKRFGIIPQQPYWLDHVSMLDNVCLPLLMQGMKQKKAIEEAIRLLKAVGLDDHIKHKPTELSGGQQQKASIARALISDPWIIFADEPTGHLDSKSIEEVVSILVEANKKGITIIMVSHDLEFLKYSKKWFFVKDGRLWDIKDRKSPFHNIKEVIGYVEDQENEKSEA